MKTILKLMIITSCMLIVNVRGFAITITVTSVTPSSTCYGPATPVIITFTKSSSGNFLPGNTFTAELSNASGSFSSPIVIGTLSGKTVAPISATIPLNTPAGSGYLIRLKSSSPALTSTNTVSFIINPIAENAGTITGLATICENTLGVSYSIAAVPNATEYIWTVPTGATITSGQNTTSIAVDFGSTSGDVTVTPTNSTCGNGGQGIKTVTVNPYPLVSTSSTNETCAKNDGTATATGGGTYLWDDPSSQVTSVATGLVAGTYNVTVTTSGCSTQKSVVVSNGCIPTTKLHYWSCGVTLTDITTPIYANAVASATAYTFNITNASLGFSYDKTTAVNYFRMSQVPGIQTGTIYSVKVKASIGAIQGEYGDSCQVTTPPNFIPLTKIQPSQCGFPVNSSSTPIYANAVVGATSYYFEVSGGSLPSPVVKLKYTRYFRLSDIPGILPNTTYNVKVKAAIGATQGNYDGTCTVTTPAVLGLEDGATARLANNETEDSLMTPSTTLSIYPNPNSGEQINVSIENLAPNSTLTITDIYGKTIVSKVLNTDLSEYNVNVKFDNKLTAGLYFINLTSNENRIVEKLVVR